MLVNYPRAFSPQFKYPLNPKGTSKRVQQTLNFLQRHDSEEYGGNRPGNKHRAVEAADGRAGPFRPGSSPVTASLRNYVPLRQFQLSRRSQNKAYGRLTHFQLLRSQNTR